MLWLKGKLIPVSLVYMGLRDNKSVRVVASSFIFFGKQIKTTAKWLIFLCRSNQGAYSCLYISNVNHQNAPKSASVQLVWTTSDAFQYRSGEDLQDNSETCTQPGRNKFSHQRNASPTNMSTLIKVTSKGCTEILQGKGRMSYTCPVTVLMWDSGVKNREDPLKS